ncbi:TIGR03667 family PPOX class F420-dependent oxidoreductase [Conexibacter sp. S30A1]|uniref:TIGR03667 family PPOX class F420-dependent oxidoreductase n=1 Tax=Conexibacter sp. S30A1 TaxID=2937800 RepID=UPI002010664B|nr:TIGR03667 family PPOX class F420-dependent oxidoreductase [Conexibacter sp. S30A1]
MIDFGGEHGARALAHLRQDPVIWLTTVSPSGAPLPMPVWFVFDGQESLLVYSINGTRVRNVGANPLVALSCPSDSEGTDVVVFSGEASFDPDAPPADQNAAYLEKYEQRIGGLEMTPASFAETYDTPIRIRLTRLRGQ